MAHLKTDLRGNHPGYFGAPSRNEVAEGQTLDHLSRPPWYERKKRRDQLMEVATENPEWAVGFCEECRWARLALPTLNS